MYTTSYARFTLIMKNVISESFKTMKIIMRILGWYPPRNYSKLYKLQGFVLYFFLLVLILAFATTNVLIEGSYSGSQIMYITETFCYCLKLLPFLTNGEEIKKCINYFNDSYFAPEDDEEEKILVESVKVCRKIFKVYVMAVGFTDVLYIVPTLFSRNYEIPLGIWLPYNVSSSALVFYPTAVYLSTGSTYATFATALVDPLIGGLAYHAVAQLKILKYRLQNLHKFEDKKLTNENLRKCIKYHNAVLRFIQEFEKCFSWTIFSQFLGTTLTLTLCCIAITTVPLVSIEAIVYISFAGGVVIWQVFFYCFYGTLLFEESNNLVTSIYMSAWYEYDIETRKGLIILMERSKRPIILRSQKLIDLTLETFSMMIKRSYSLIAVFK